MLKVRDCIPKRKLLNLEAYYSKTYWPNLNLTIPFMKSLENDFEVNCDKY
jgi:hypothetical protein